MYVYVDFGGASITGCYRVVVCIHARGPTHQHNKTQQQVFEAWQEGLSPPTATSSSTTSSSFPSRRVALKVLRPVPHWRVEREVRTERVYT